MKQKFSFSIGEQRFIYQQAPGAAPDEVPSAPKISGEPTVQHETPEIRAKAATGAAGEKLTRVEEGPRLKGPHAKAYQDFDIYIGTLGDQILDIWQTNGNVENFQGMVVDGIHAAFDKAGIRNQAPTAHQIEQGFRGLGGGNSTEVLQNLFDSYRQTARAALFEKQRLAERYQAFYRTVEDLVSQYQAAPSGSPRKAELLSTLTGFLTKNYGVDADALGKVNFRGGGFDIADKLAELAFGSQGIDPQKAKKEYATLVAYENTK